jgi:hypothetical protein
MGVSTQRAIFCREQMHNAGIQLNEMNPVLTPAAVRAMDAKD